MRERKGDFIATFSGRAFWPFDPRPEDVVIEDIAHALSIGFGAASRTTSSSVAGLQRQPNGIFWRGFTH